MQSIRHSLGLGVQQVRAGAYIPIGWKIVHIQWPNIEALCGAGIVRHGLLDLCAN